MSLRLAAAAALVGVGLIAAGCGADTAAPAAADGGRTYVGSAQDLMVPVGQLASAIADRVDHPDGAPPSRRELDEILRRADAGLAAFRAVDPGDPSLRRQQRRLAAQYTVLVGAMPPVIDVLASGAAPDRLARAAHGFFVALDALPAAAEPAS